MIRLPEALKSSIVRLRKFVSFTDTLMRMKFLERFAPLASVGSTNVIFGFVKSMMNVRFSVWF